MILRLSALAVMLAIGAGSLVADEKAKKSSEEIKGTVAKFNVDKRTVSLKTGSGDKDYTLADNVVVMFPGGQRFEVSTKMASGAKADQQKGTDMLQRLLTPGAEVSLTLGKGDTVTVVNVNPHAAKPNQMAPMKSMQKRGG
jgi:hypothetical protein